MEYAYYVFGELGFSPAKLKGWRIARVDPAGRAWEREGIYDGKFNPFTIPVLVESGKVFSKSAQGQFFSVFIGKDRATFRGYLGKDDLGWARQLAAAARLAGEDFGAKGELVFLMSTGDGVSRVIAGGGATWEEAGRTEAAAYMKRPEVDEILARLEGKPAPSPAREERAAARELGLGDVSEMAFGLPKDADERRALRKPASGDDAEIEGRAIEALAKLPAARVLEAARKLDEGVIVYRRDPRGGGEPIPARTAFDDGAKLIDEVRETHEKGSTAAYGKSLQGLALPLLGAIDAKAATPLALALWASKTAPPQLRAAALRALGYGDGDEALEALMSALTHKQPEVVREAAIEALSRSRHPAAGERVLALLRARLGKAPYKVDAAAVQPLLTILGGLAYAPALELLLSLWKRGPADLRPAAGAALVGLGTPEAIDPVAEKWRSPKDDLAMVGIRAVFRRAPRQAFDTFAPVFAVDFGKDQEALRRAEDVLRALASEAALREDPRWIELSTRLLSSSWLQSRALAALAASHAPSAAQAIVANLGTLDLDEAGDALVALGDRSAAAALRAAAEGQRKPRATKLLRIAERLEALPPRSHHVSSEK